MGDQGSVRQLPAEIRLKQLTGMAGDGVGSVVIICTGCMTHPMTAKHERKALDGLDGLYDHHPINGHFVGWCEQCLEVCIGGRQKRT